MTVTSPNHAVNITSPQDDDGAAVPVNSIVAALAGSQVAGWDTESSAYYGGQTPRVFTTSAPTVMTADLTPMLLDPYGTEDEVLYFNGAASNYLELELPPTLDGDFSIQFWVAHAALGATETIVQAPAYSPATQQTGFRISKNAGDTYTADIRDSWASSANNQNVLNNSAVLATVWYFYRLEISATEGWGRLFRGVAPGGLAASGPKNAALYSRYHLQTALCLGGDLAGSYLTGYICDFRIYNQVLDGDVANVLIPEARL